MTHIVKGVLLLLVIAATSVSPLVRYGINVDLLQLSLTLPNHNVIHDCFSRSGTCVSSPLM